MRSVQCLVRKRHTCQILKKALLNSNVSMISFHVCLFLLLVVIKLGIDSHHRTGWVMSMLSGHWATHTHICTQQKSNYLQAPCDLHLNSWAVAASALCAGPLGALLSSACPCSAALCPCRRAWLWSSDCQGQREGRGLPVSQSLSSPGSTFVAISASVILVRAQTR